MSERCSGFSQMMFKSPSKLNKCTSHGALCYFSVACQKNASRSSFEPKDTDLLMEISQNETKTELLYPNS